MISLPPHHELSDGDFDDVIDAGGSERGGKVQV